MTTANTFTVFGDPVEILISSEATHGAFSVLTQTCHPGGGPPPHVHRLEDEIFTTLDGEFELFDGSTWHPLRRGDVRYALRGQVHAFRNSGTALGKILVTVTPGGLDHYLRAISLLVMPQDIAELISISEPYGLAFPGLKPLSPSATPTQAAGPALAH